MWKLYEALDQELGKARPAGLEYRKANEIMNRELIHVRPGGTVGDAMQLMKKHDYSQLPVLEGGRVVGTVYQRQIVDLLTFGKNPAKETVGQTMKEALPQISGQTPLAKVSSLLEHWPAVLVADSHELTGIITPHDWFKLASQTRK